VFEEDVQLARLLQSVGAQASDKNGPAVAEAVANLDDAELSEEQRLKWKSLTVTMISYHRLAMFLQQTKNFQLQGRGSVDAVARTT